MQIIQTRRRFLAGAAMAGAAAAGAVGFVGLPTSAHAEPPPETTTVRLPKLFRSVCLAPQNIAEELLRAEGFTDVRYVETPVDADPVALLASGELDFDLDFAPAHVTVDRGRRTDQGACRTALRVPRTDRQRQHPQHHGPARASGWA